MYLSRFLAASLVALITLAAPALPSLRATDSTLDSGFVSTISPGLTPDSYPTFDNGTGAVNAVALQSDGKILSGGNISRYQAPAAGSPQTSLKRLNPDGSLDTLTSFNTFASTLADSQGQTEVNAILPIAGDQLYVGGVFTSYQSTARGGVLRLNSDGSLDPAFAAAGISNSNAFGIRYVLALAEQPDGKLLVGGGFNRANGTYRPNLARFLANGTLDAGFDPAAALANSSFIGDIALLPNGQILVSGGRNRTGGGSVPLLVRLNSDGSLDPAFAPAFADDYGDLDELLLLPDGRIVVSGDLALASSSGVHRNVACFLSDGTVDPTFMANLGSGPNGWAGGELVLQPDGTLLVGGIFNSWNGQPRASLARLQSDGTLDPALAVLPYSPDRNNYLTHFYSFATQPDGKLVVGGWFSRITNPAVETYNLTRITNEFSASSPGTLRLLSTSVTTAENAASVTLQVSRFGGLVGAVSVNFATLTGGADGTATATSDYTTSTGTLSWAAGEGGFKTITVPLLQDTAIESSETFTVALSGVTGGATLPPAASRATVTLRDDDSAPVITTSPASVSLEQGAGFTLSVRYDSVLPATVQWQRDPDGAGPLPFANLPGATGINYPVANADPATHAGDYRAIVTNQPNGSPASATSGVATVSISTPAGSVVTTFAPADIGSITAAAPDATGRILVLTSAGLRRLGADGVAEPTTSFGISILNSTAYALLPLADGRLLVGGAFATQTHQPSATASSLSRLLRVNADATGTIDTGFSVTVPNAVAALAPGASGKFYTGLIGASTSGNGLLRFLSTGAADPAWTPAVNTIATGTSSIVHAVRELSDGRVLVSYTSGNAAGGGITYILARLTTSGALDTTFGTGGRVAFNQPPRAFDVLPDGRIAVVGSFTTVGGVARQRVALLLADGGVDPTFEFPATFDAGGVPIGVRYRDGRLLISGNFTTVGGTTQGNLARFNLDGSNDPSFSVGVGASGAFGHTINTTFYTASGEIFIGGSFTSFKGVPRNRAALLVGNPQIGAIGFAPPRVSVNDTGGPLTLTLHRYGPATESVSIAYTTADAASGTSATAGADYTASTGTVTWTAGDASDKAVVIQLLDDSALESSETFRVLLSAPVGPVTAAAPATVTLLDDDTPVTFTSHPFVTDPATGSPYLAGTNITLGSAVSSPTSVSRQWFFNGVAIPGATSATFNLPAATLAQAGLYTMIATNAAGSVTSDPFLLYIRQNPADLDAGWPHDFVINGTVRALAPTPDGGLYVGGEFTAFDGQPGRNYLVKLLPDGTLDPAFNPTPGAAVNALALDAANQRLYVLGSFTAIGGGAALNNFAALDASTGARAGAFMSALGSGANSTVRALAVLSDGDLLLGGDFTSYNSAVTHRSLARLNPDGTLHTPFDTSALTGSSSVITALDAEPADSTGAGGGFVAGGFFSYSGASRLARFFADGSRDTAFAPAPIGGTVTRLRYLANGSIMATGTNLPGGNRTITRMSPTGGWTSGDYFGTTSGTFNDFVYQPNGRTIGVGSFNFVRTPSGTVSNVSSFNSTGNYDGAWPTGVGFNDTAHVAALAPDARVWIGGAFTAYNGAPVQRLVRLAADRVPPGIVNPPVDTAIIPGQTARFSVGALGSDNTPAGLSYRWSRNGVPLDNGGDLSGVTTSILTIANADASDDADYTVTVTFDATMAIATSAPVHLHVLGAPIIVSSPSATSIFAGANLTLAAEAYALAPATYVWRRDGMPIADGGRFSGATTASLTITGATTSDTGTYTLTVTNGLGQEATDPIFVLVTGLPAGRAPAYAGLASTTTVRAFLPLPDGRTLVATGGGVLSNGASSASSAALAFAHADGTVSNLGRDPATNAVLPFIAGNINAVLRQPDGKFVIGGAFTTVNGVSINRIARLHTDGSLDTSFNPGTGAGNTVNTLAFDATGRLIVGGQFTNFAGVSGRNYLVRLEADGALDATFTPGFTGVPNKLLSLPDGGFLVGGDFFSPGQRLVRYDSTGALVNTFAPNPTGTVYDLDLAPGGTHFYAAVNAAPYIVRYTVAGAVDPTFVPGEPLTNSPFSIAVQEDGSVLGFGSINGPLLGLVRYRATGALDSDFIHSGVSSDTHLALTVDSAGRIWLGGSFTTFSSTPASRIAVLNGSPVALGFARQPLARSVEAGQSTTFTAEAVATAPVTYQWFKGPTPLADGPGVSGATTANLTLTGITVADEGLYSVQASTPSAGPITSAPAELVFLAAPEIVVAPTGGTFEAGVARTLTVTARGAGTLSYQWFRGTATTPIADISGATSLFYTLNTPTAADTSYYGVRITNSLGEISSTPVLLTFGTYAGSLASAQLPTFNNTVNKVIPLADGGFFAAGQFTAITPLGGFSTTRRGFARILADGTFDAAFVYVNNSSVTVSDAVRDSQGRFIVAGNFNTLLSGGNVTRNSLARLTPAGALDTTFGTTTSPLTSALGNITVLALDSTDGVYVGGGFTNFGGTTGANYLVRLDPATGARDPAFTAVVTGPVGSIHVLANGQLLVGGASPDVGGPGFGLRRLNSNGTHDTSFVYAPGSGTVTSILPVAGSSDFLLATRTGLKRITSSGALVSGWPANTDDTSDLLALNGGGYVVGGIFTTYAGVSSPKIALLNADGTRSSAFNVGTGFNNTVNHLALAADGRIYAAGQFTSYRGVTTSRVVLLNATDTIPADPGAPATADPFDEYLAEAGVPAGQRGATADPDGDGIANLLEFALGLDPGDYDNDGLPVAELVGGLLTLTYDRAQPGHVAYEVQTATDLANAAGWTATGVDQGTPAGDGITTASVPVGSGSRFLRLQVTLLP